MRLLRKKYLAVSRSLFSGQADEKASAGFGRVALEQLEHVATGLGHGGHLGDDGQVVNDERDFILLVPGHGLGVTQKTEAYKRKLKLSICFCMKELQRQVMSPNKKC